MEYRVTCRRGAARYAAVVTAESAHEAVGMVRQSYKDKVESITVRCSAQTASGEPCGHWSPLSRCAQHA